MLIAIVVGGLGWALSYGIGMHLLDLTAGEVTRAILTCQFTTFIGILGVLKGERTPWIKATLLRGTTGTWLAMSSIYLVPLWVINPPLRNLHHFAWMFLPTFMSVGWALLALGPVQDRIVARIQKKARTRT
ncbi:hypothetical protein K2X30_12015 [bacterium]|jgi:hypothetical protein|nr:hypothetical protein [bacterium]